MSMRNQPPLARNGAAATAADATATRVLPTHGSRLQPRAPGGALRSSGRIAGLPGGAEPALDRPACIRPLPAASPASAERHGAVGPDLHDIVSAFDQGALGEGRAVLARSPTAAAPFRNLGLTQ